MSTSFTRLTPLLRFSQATRLPLSGAALAAVMLLSGCQTMRSAAPVSTPAVSAAKLDQFAITGKIGVVSPQDQPGQSGSAFYAWGQQGQRFTIEITGALGIGHTVITYDGSTATLQSERTGRISAADPEALLRQATGWQAPISQLPYWISGRSAPSDSADQQDDLGRLQLAHNAGWQARFAYADGERLPNKIIASNQDGYKVIMTIRHQADSTA